MSNQGETRSDKFHRIAARRADQVLEGIRKLTNLANLGAYEFSEEDVQSLFDAIEENVELARKKFEAELKFRGKGTGFQFRRSRTAPET